MSESAETRIRRLRMRSMRRGIKEMDLILSRFADAALAEMDPTELAAYDALLSENDQDLFAWVTGQAAPPARFDPLIRRIAAEVGASGAARP